MVNCDIYECSIGGIDIYNCNGVNLDNNAFRDIGDEYGPGFWINVSDCTEVTVDGQEVGDSYSYSPS